MTSSSGPYSSFSSSTDFNIGSDLSFDQAVDFGKSLGLDNTVFQELKGIDFSQSFYDPDLARFFGESSTEQKQLPASAPPANPDYYIYDNKGSGGSYAVPMAKNLMGANLDVVSTLQAVQFEQFGDGSLKNSIAYIIPWQRASSSSKVPASASVENAPRANFFQELINDVSPFGFDDPGYFDGIDGLDTSFVPLWEPEESSWFLSSEENIFNTSLDFYVGNDRKGDLTSDYFTNFVNVGPEGESSLSTSAAEKRQTAVSSEIPMGWKQGLLAGGRFLADQLIEDKSIGNFADTALLQAAKMLNTPSGPVYIGNANGIVNQVLDIANVFGLNVPRGLTTSIAPDLQSKTSKMQGFTASAPVDGMWQFLFNPSELTLSAGPNFKKSETWGVSDEANTGQPLHWTNNKNTTLQFSKVLLNGYIFGKKVESLEQGLFELFLKNPTNDAKHGPRVLEFVWGKRSFGPCVIKDIKVNEKMWDDGLLVNAEVSFTLEKVPEWTINDGQVSTFDPTAHPVASSPESTTSEEARTGQDGKEKTQPSEEEKTEKFIEEANKALGLEEALPASVCNQQINFAQNLRQLQEKAGINVIEWSRGIPSEGKAKGAQIQYSNLLAANGSVLNRISVGDDKCSKKCERSLYRKKDGIKFVYDLAGQLSCVRDCSALIAGKIEAVNRKKCAAGFTPSIGQG